MQLELRLCLLTWNISDESSRHTATLQVAMNFLEMRRRWHLHYKVVQVSIESKDRLDSDLSFRLPVLCLLPLAELPPSMCPWRELFCTICAVSISAGNAGLSRSVSSPTLPL